MRSGEEALRAFRESPPDLVVLDINIPGLNGFEIREEIRQFLQVPIIMLFAMS